jgi:2-polyprenyl-6-hydroxyphenyl methylase/3-demethylubiquinone-9 3-methyltransferase
MAFHAAGGLAKDLVRLRNPLARYRQYDRLRGMSWWHDQLDWIGGYPFETATPESIVECYSERGFHLERLVPCRRGSSGCNQFVFRRRHD